MWLAGMVLTKSSHWRSFPYFNRRESLTQSKIQPTKRCVYKTSGYFGSPRGAVELLKSLLPLACHGSGLFLDYDLLSDTNETMIRPVF
jgi:hypothetical protein